MKLRSETQTSVKVDDAIFKKFKIATVMTQTNIKRLVNAAMARYSDKDNTEFKEYVDSFTIIDANE